MKIILLREKGRSHSIRVLRRTVVVSLISLSLLTTAGGIFVFQGLTREVADEAVVAGWRERLAQQQAEVDKIRDRSAAESEAVGRQLAQMQARLLRMEALGARVTEVADLTDETAVSALRAFLGDDANAFANELVDEIDGELSPEQQGNLYSLIQQMNVMQKIKLARMGNKEARGLLVRDRNKLIATAAIRSPKVTVNEVEGFSRARNLSDVVLRTIAMNREWTRRYQVKLGLATNPKCPINHAVKFLNFLQERDLRNVMKSKDVPSAISAHARRLLQKKGKI